MGTRIGRWTLRLSAEWRTEGDAASIYRARHEDDSWVVTPRSPEAIAAFGSDRVELAPGSLRRSARIVATALGRGPSLRRISSYTARSDDGVYALIRLHDGRWVLAGLGPPSLIGDDDPARAAIRRALVYGPPRRTFSTRRELLAAVDASLGRIG